MSRFDYIGYDDISADTQQQLKSKFKAIETNVNGCIADGRAKSLIMTHLEIAYMWSGKAIRDDQILREGPQPEKKERG